MIQGLANFWALSGYTFDLTEKYSALWAIYRQVIQPQGAGKSS
jgi:hypothetical protein